jgi:hypothetical protein
VKVDVKTLDGADMIGKAATEPIGSALRIAPGFVATATDEDAGIETTIEVHYSAKRERYVITAILNRAIREDFDDDRLRYTPPQAILRAAIPHCVTVRLDDGPDAQHVTVSDLTAADGRIIPQWMADAVTKRGVKDARWDVIEILYGTSVLADIPALRTIATELGIPERTASYWISEARAAGRLNGITANTGRPVSD